MNKEIIRQSAAYRELMEDYVLRPAGQDTVADVEDCALWQDARWRDAAHALAHVQAGANGTWAANVLLVHPGDPFSFLKVPGQACRTRQLATIVAGYTGKIQCGDPANEGRTLTKDDLRLCAN